MEIATDDGHPSLEGITTYKVGFERVQVYLLYPFCWNDLLSNMTFLVRLGLLKLAITISSLAAHWNMGLMGKLSQTVRGSFNTLPATLP